ncbi:cocaine- and amphetamine-regulated transcript protein-like [Microcaecilia unicolor]|uniref:Cocaine- and amphetamine-regulated transcript protein-like n=1 Tax=Microcaecilia unicolor TaxID=1415580 RepID=A0A6P7WYS0_9AMPH|nr:cocaine- and amphetamine-regulated transcript protein-like [Microcaecilia unicolor]
MESSALLIKLFCASLLLSSLCRGQSSREMSSEEYREKKSPSSAEKELVEAMEELLGKFQNKYPSYQKKAAQIPMCDIGERCAVKQGPRIGKLCDCSRGAICNTFLLKCI